MLFKNVLVALMAAAAVAAQPVDEARDLGAVLEGREAEPEAFPDAMPEAEAEADLEERDLEDRDVEPRALCPGNYINGGPWGRARWELFYSSANGGTNCAILYNNSGKRHNMAITLSVAGGQSRTDRGNFLSYAGPVKVTGTNGRCIKLNFKFDQSTASKGWFHCS